MVYSTPWYLSIHPPRKGTNSYVFQVDGFVQKVNPESRVFFVELFFCEMCHRQKMRFHNNQTLVMAR